MLTRTPSWPQYAVRLGDTPFGEGAEGSGTGEDPLILRPALLLR